MKLLGDPLAGLPYLDALHGDGTRFVTRSVANHLNDIAKIDADAVVARLADWQGRDVQTPREMAWMTRHALRTLVKKGHGGALAMLGYHADAPVTGQVRLARDVVAIGDMISFDVALRADQDTPVLVDYVIWFNKSNGTLSPKVFKLKQAVIKGGQELEMAKSYRLKGGATTLPLYAGAHRLGVQVNGRIVDVVDFTLIAAT